MLDITFWKFVLVGIVNTLVGTGVMFAAYNLLHLSYWVSSASNYVVGSIVSYFLNKYFTFQNKERSWKQLGMFVINITICYLLAYGMQSRLCHGSFIIRVRVCRRTCLCWLEWVHLWYSIMWGRGWLCLRNSHCEKSTVTS
mgnify:FL=1